MAPGTEEHDNERVSLALLRRRVAELPSHLRGAFLAWDESVAPRQPLARRLVVSGAGGSEGPARFLVALATRHLAVRAHFAPLSAFVAPNELCAGDTLVLFSQSLSPNARLAVACCDDFAHALLFTSVPPDAGAARDDAKGVAFAALGLGARVVVLPPADESRLFLRIVGPAVATLGAVLLCTDMGRALTRPLFEALPDLPALMEAALGRVAEGVAAVAAEPPFSRIALVTAGGYGEYCHGLRWKLLEGLGVPEPPLWDVLQVVHGPFQQFHDERLLVCTLESAARPAERPLFDRLAKVLVAGRHHLLRLEAEGEPPLAWFEHDAMLNGLLLALLAKRPRDLVDWPGKGADAALYELGADMVPRR